MKRIVGLTGPTGSGKSLIAKTAETLGVRVVDCDAAGREAVERGTPGLAALVDAFGREILREDGTLDRKRLAALAFSSPENTERLNQTLLPYIVKLLKGRLTGDRILLDAPTLFESGMDSVCQETVAVLARRRQDMVKYRV